MKEHQATLQSNALTGDCPGHSPHLTADGEYVCTKCGAVLSDDYDWSPDEGMSPVVAVTAPSPKSSVNLYLAHRLGGSEVRSLPGLSTSRGLEVANREGTIEKGNGKKKKSANAYLSMFSNACSKLGLTQAESEYAWRLFARLYGELSASDGRVTNTSEIACYAIAAGAAATTHRLLDERTVARAVMFAFRSKSVRDMYSIRRVIETRSQAVTGIAKPALTSSARWLRGRL